MNTVDIDAEEGFQAFKIGDKLIKVDVFEAMSKVRQAVKERQAFPDQAASSEDTIVEEVISYLLGLGFPKISHTVALKIMKHLQKSAEEIKKNIVENLT